MRYAIVSDIHANLQAWNAVLQDIHCSRIDRIICLGDIVGYGPRPASVLQSVHSHAHSMILGNHDAVVAGKLDIKFFNPRAAERIVWTKENLAPKAVDILGKLPLQLTGDNFRCAHGEFSDPAAFKYIFDPPDAQASWETVTEPLLFVGHTHNPGIFLLGHSGIPRYTEPQNFEQEPGKRYIVNVGSVGQPRDDDPRSCYCIYDTSRNSVFWRRVPFDIEAYRTELAAAGFEPDCEAFLQKGAPPPIREQINFAPPSSPENHAKDVVLEQAVAAELIQRISRLKMISIFLATITLALLITAPALINMRKDKPLCIPKKPLQPDLFAEASPTTGFLPPIPPESSPATGINGWRIILGNSKKQNITVVETDRGPCLKLSSRDPKALISIESPSLRVRSQDKLQISALFKTSDTFEGNIKASIELIRTVDGKSSSIPSFISVIPNLPRVGGWKLAQKTFRVPSGSELITPSFQGFFKGYVIIKSPTLKPR